MRLLLSVECIGIADIRGMHLLGGGKLVVGMVNLCFPTFSYIKLNTHSVYLAFNFHSLFLKRQAHFQFLLQAGILGLCGDCIVMAV